MFSLLAMVATAFLLGAALLWRAVLLLSGARPVAIFRGLLRKGSTLIDRVFLNRASLRTARNRRAGVP